MPLTEKQAVLKRICINALELLDIMESEVEWREDYNSGWSRKTLGVVIPRDRVSQREIHVFIAAIACVVNEAHMTFEGEDHEFDQFDPIQLARDAGIDSMGHDTIVYWDRYATV